MRNDSNRSRASKYLENPPYQVFKTAPGAPCIAAGTTASLAEGLTESLRRGYRKTSRADSPLAR